MPYVIYNTDGRPLLARSK